MFRVATFTMQDASTVVTQMSAAIVHDERERVLRNLLDVCVEEGLIVVNGNKYTLAEDILRLVKKIPDWLKDGFVDAQSFLKDLTEFEDPSAESTGVVHVRHVPRLTNLTSASFDLAKNTSRHLPQLLARW